LLPFAQFCRNWLSVPQRAVIPERRAAAFRRAPE
jgi:hypothetical protein